MFTFEQIMIIFAIAGLVAGGLYALVGMAEMINQRTKKN